MRRERQRQRRQPITPAWRWVRRLGRLAFVGALLTLAGRAYLAVADGTLLWGHRNAVAVPAGTPELVLQLGHQGAIYGLAFSSDGKILASSSDDGTVKLWDGTSGALKRTLRGWDTPNSYAFSGWSRVGVWPGAPQQLVFSADGRWLAGASGNGGVYLWDLRADREKMTRVLRSPALGPFDNVRSLAFSPDGRRLAAGSGHRHASLWNVRTGRVDRVLQSDFWVLALGFSQDGKRLLGVDGSGIVQWDLARNGRRQRLRRSDKEVTEAAIWTGSRTIAAIACDNELTVWDVAARRRLARLVTRDRTSPNLIGDGRLLVTRSDSGSGSQVTLWVARTGSHLTSISLGARPVGSLAISPAGRTIACAKYSPGPLPASTLQMSDLELRDAETGRIRATMSAREPDGQGTLTLAPSGGKAAVFEGNRPGVAVWDLRRGRLQQKLMGAGVPATVAFETGGEEIVVEHWVTTPRARTSTVRSWDIVSGRVRRTLSAREARAWRQRHSSAVGWDGSWTRATPDGVREVLATAQGSLVVLNRGTKQRRVLRSGLLQDLIGPPVISADGGFIAAQLGPLFTDRGPEPKKLALWDARTGVRLRLPPLKEPYYRLAVAWAPNSRTLAIATDGNPVRLWSVAPFGRWRSSRTRRGLAPQSRSPATDAIW
jgi:WD40 repeat protein